MEESKESNGSNSHQSLASYNNKPSDSSAKSNDHKEEERPS